MLLHCPVEVVHVIETDVMEELALDLASHDAGIDVASKNVDRVRAAGLAGGGHLLRVISDHGEVGRRIARFANEHHATMVVIGVPADAKIAWAFDADLTETLIQAAHCAVHIVPSGIDWFNHRRLHGEITDDTTYVTPAEREAANYRETEAVSGAVTQ